MKEAIINKTLRFKADEKLEIVLLNHGFIRKVIEKKIVFRLKRAYVKFDYINIIISYGDDYGIKKERSVDYEFLRSYLFFTSIDTKDRSFLKRKGIDILEIGKYLNKNEDYLCFLRTKSKLNYLRIKSDFNKFKIKEQS